MKSAPASTEQRLIATVAWLYHSRGLRQSQIGERLNLSQSRVSRLLDQAVDLAIVKTIIVLPTSEQSVLEQELESAYGLKEAHVFDLGHVGDESQLLGELGELLALHLQTTPLNAHVVGLTSWSRTLQHTVNALRSLPQPAASYVVEMLGDLGPPALQHRAAQNTQLLADMAGAKPMFLRVPGVMTDPDLKRKVLEQDGHARSTLRQLDGLDFTLTGIGAVGVVAPLRAGDNFFTKQQIAQAKKHGAVGEVNLRYLADNGEPVATDFDDLIVGATLQQLRRADRRLMVAGGRSKYRAIRAALVGGWLNVVFTDATTARWLIANRDRPARPTRNRR